MGRLDLLDALLGLDGGLLGFLQRAGGMGEDGVDLVDVRALDEHRSHDVGELVHGECGFAQGGQFFVRGGEFRLGQLVVLTPFVAQFTEVVPRGLATDSLDAAHAGSDRPLALDLEKSDLGSVANVGAATKLHRWAIELMRLAADLYDAHRISVLVAKELHDVRTALDVGVFHFGPGNGQALPDGAVDHVLHH